MIRTVAFAGHRSLRDLRLSIGRLTVITGAAPRSEPKPASSPAIS